MKALRFTVRLDVWPPRRQEAAIAARRLRQLADYFEKIPPDVFDNLPTGGITGEPSEATSDLMESPLGLLQFISGALSGIVRLEEAWKAVWEVEERE